MQAGTFESWVCKVSQIHDRIKSSNFFFFLKSGDKSAKLISQDVRNTNNYTDIWWDSLLNRKERSGRHKSPASVSYSTSNQVNVHPARPGRSSTLRKIEKTHYIGHFFSRDGTSPRWLHLGNISGLYKGKSKISQVTQRLWRRAMEEPCVWLLLFMWRL